MLHCHPNDKGNHRALYPNDKGNHRVVYKDVHNKFDKKTQRPKRLYQRNEQVRI